MSSFHAYEKFLKSTLRMSGALGAEPSDAAKLKINKVTFRAVFMSGDNDDIGSSAKGKSRVTGRIRKSGVEPPHSQKRPAADGARYENKSSDVKLLLDEPVNICGQCA